MPVVNHRLVSARKRVIPILTQAGAADAIGLSEIYIHLLERGRKVNPSSAVRVALARLYGTTPGDLFDEWMMEVVV